MEVYMTRSRKDESVFIKQSRTLLKNGTEAVLWSPPTDMCTHLQMYITYTHKHTRIQTYTHMCTHTPKSELFVLTM